MNFSGIKSYIIKALQDIFVKNILFFYTLLVLFLKTLVLLGLIVDNTHTSILFEIARKIAWEHFDLYLGPVLILLAFSFLFKNRARLWYLLSVNFLISLLFLIDTWYFRGFGTMPTPLALLEGSNLSSIGGSILGTMRLIDLIYIVDVILIMFAVLFIKQIYKTVDRQYIIFAITLVASVALILYTPLDLKSSGRSVSDVLVFKYDSTVTCYNLSPLGYHAYSLYNTWKNSRELTLSDKDTSDIKAWFKGNQENLPPNRYKGLFEGKNLLVIQVESLERFVINQKINGVEITPNLNKLLKNSLYFSNVIEQVHEGNTSDAELMGNTSVYPLLQGSTFFLHPYNSYNSLPKLMEKKGYSTLALHPDEGSFWNWMISLKSIGFQKCMDVSKFINDEQIIMGLSDGSFLNQVEPVLLKQKQPFYSFMITMTNHTPYDIPSKYRELPLNWDLNDSYLGGYLQCVHYTDKHLGILMDKLQKDGLLDNTVVILYGDHEGIHKYFPDSLYKIKPSQNWWMDNQKGTPLIVYQNKLPGEEIKTYGGEIDVLPTIAYLMGVDENKYADTAMGRNLLNTRKNYTILNNGSVLGEKGSKEDMEHDIKGLGIADMIIRSNYFKK